MHHGLIEIPSLPVLAADWPGSTDTAQAGDDGGASLPRAPAESLRADILAEPTGGDPFGHPDMPFAMQAFDEL